MDRYDIIVIGSGPAGLFAAGQCGRAGLKVLLLEKKQRLGLKLLASGSGQCNITNREDEALFVTRFGERERFVRKAIQSFTAKDLLTFFEDRGIGFESMPSGKVFPESRKAEDVLRVLVRELHENHVKVLVGSRVEAIAKEGSRYVVKASDASYMGSCVLIATGGKSYPNLGTTGDGYRLAESLGHTIVQPKPSLAPVYNKSFDLLELAGMTFRDVTLSLWRGNKKQMEMSGDLLITHKGLSGPVVLDHSRFFEKGDQLQINFVRFRSEADFKTGFEQNLQSNKKTTIKRMLDMYDVPKRLIEKLLELTGTPSDTKCAELPKGNRKALIKALIAYPFEIDEVGDYNVAMATTGGIDTKQVHSQTYESRISDGLYFAGEVIDVDGNTGGYNIQFAFSSAYLAAQAMIDKARGMDKPRKDA